MILSNKKQNTLKKEIKLNGIGLHTGSEINLTLKPAEENSGFNFVRSDIDPDEKIPALANFVTHTERGTTITKGGSEVKTIEHLLAALVGCEINNCLIDVDGPEIPILDGSSKIFTDAIISAGTEKQEALQRVFVVEENLKIKDDSSGITNQNHSVLKMLYLIRLMILMIKYHRQEHLAFYTNLKIYLSQV